MIRVLGTGRAVMRLAAVGVRVQAAAPAATGAIAEGVAEAARARVPVLTGETRESIAVVPEGVQAAGAARWLEFGTYRMAAEPFMRPAADEADASRAALILRAALRGL